MGIRAKWNESYWQFPTHSSIQYWNAMKICELWSSNIWRFGILDRCNCTSEETPRIFNKLTFRRLFHSAANSVSKTPCSRLCFHTFWCDLMAASSRTVGRAERVCIPTKQQNCARFAKLWHLKLLFVAVSVINWNFLVAIARTNAHSCMICNKFRRTVKCEGMHALTSVRTECEWIRWILKIHVMRWY